MNEGRKEGKRKKKENASDGWNEEEGMKNKTNLFKDCRCQ